MKTKNVDPRISTPYFLFRKLDPNGYGGPYMRCEEYHWDQLDNLGPGAQDGIQKRGFQWGIHSPSQWQDGFELKVQFSSIHGDRFVDSDYNSLEEDHAQYFHAYGIVLANIHRSDHSATQANRY